MSDMSPNNLSCQWQKKQALLLDVNWRHIACFAAATSLNTGPASKIVVFISHRHTKTWEHRVQVYKHLFPFNVMSLHTLQINPTSLLYTATTCCFTFFLIALEQGIDTQNVRNTALQQSFIKISSPSDQKYQSETQCKISHHVEFKSFPHTVLTEGEERCEWKEHSEHRTTNTYKWTWANCAMGLI